MSVLVKIDISGSDPVTSYADAGCYPHSKIRISTDGNLLFTCGKEKFTIDPSMTGNGIIKNENLAVTQEYIHAMADNPQYHEYYFVASNYDLGMDENCSKLLVMDKDFSLSKTLTLEPFYMGAEPQGHEYYTNPAGGEQGFPSADGKKIVVISAAVGYPDLWGGEIINRNRI